VIQKSRPQFSAPTHTLLAHAATPLRLRFLALAGIACATIALVGCQGHGNGSDAQVRMINAYPSQNPLSFAINGRNVVDRSQFGSCTDYAGINSGTYAYDISSGAVPLGHGELTVEKGMRYAVVACPSAAAGGDAVSFVASAGDATPGRGKATITFVQAADAGTPIDLLFNSVVGAESEDLGAQPATLTLNPGSYDLRANAAGDPNCVFAEVPFEVSAGKSYLIILMGRRSTSNLTLRTFEL